MHTFDSHIKVPHPKIRSRYVRSTSNFELITWLSDHMDLRNDIILLILVIKVGVFHESARISRNFLRKSISLMSIWAH